MQVVTPELTLKYIILSIWLAIPFSLYAVPLRSVCSLYSDSPNIQCLTASNVASHVGNSPTLWLIEFYSSSCGHCIAFAPTYRELSNSIKTWNKFIRLAVLDCATSMNRATCQEFKVYYFPSFKSISPFSDVDGDKFAISRRDIPSITNLLTDLVIENKQKYNEDIKAYIQQLEPLYCDMDLDQLFESSREVCILLIAELAGSYTGKQVMLDVADQTMHRTDIKIRRLLITENTDCPLIPSTQYASDVPHLIFFRNATLTLQYHSNLDDARTHYTSIISQLITSSRSVTKLSDSEIENAVHLPNSVKDVSNKDENSGLELGEVLFNRIRHGFTTSDIINSVSYSLRHEVSLKEQISGEDINSLLNYLLMLDHILPQLHPKTSTLLSALIKELTRFTSSPSHVVSHSMTGREWDLLVSDKLDKSVFPINPRWVGCRGSKPYLRGYTCGLWVLFHLSLTHVSLEVDTDPELSAVNVAAIIKEYIVRFFSCADCKLHFVRMSTRLELQITTDREAVMWFWIAHNKINERLKDDSSTDPIAPKIQFPPQDICPSCRFSAPILNPTSEVFSLNSVTWNTTEVHNFLMSYYNRHKKEKLGDPVIFSQHLVPICYLFYGLIILLLIFLVRKICHRKQRILNRFKQY
ncbi:Oxidase 1 [Oopsacas minuta]|uniref:Sulfhydryl oxidase n=1 Tax=Oopsacas minuta TaxID=111878 RepID=A0AAV7KHX1_9METZ|nr:Oxidase 1 [Oopsacas minuta]